MHLGMFFSGRFLRLVDTDVSLEIRLKTSVRCCLCVDCSANSEIEEVILRAFFATVAPGRPDAISLKLEIVAPKLPMQGTSGWLPNEPDLHPGFVHGYINGVKNRIINGANIYIRLHFCLFYAKLLRRHSHHFAKPNSTEWVVSWRRRESCQAPSNLWPSLAERVFNRTTRSAV